MLNGSGRFDDTWRHLRSNVWWQDSSSVVRLAQTLWYPIVDHGGRWVRRLMEDEDDRTTLLSSDGGEVHR